jgi:hypothetical protein
VYECVGRSVCTSGCSGCCLGYLFCPRVHRPRSAAARRPWGGARPCRGRRGWLRAALGTLEEERPCRAEADGRLRRGRQGPWELNPAEGAVAIVGRHLGVEVYGLVVLFERVGEVRLLEQLVALVLDRLPTSSHRAQRLPMAASGRRPANRPERSGSV